jgi:hypothetical protein
VCIIAFLLKLGKGAANSCSSFKTAAPERPAYFFGLLMSLLIRIVRVR